MTGQPWSRASGSTSFSRAGSPVIELISGAVRVTASAAVSAAGLALSRHSGRSTASWTVSTSHLRSSGSRSGRVPALTSIRCAPAAACLAASDWMNAASRSAMALPTCPRVPLIFSPMMWNMSHPPVNLGTSAIVWNCIERANRRWKPGKVVSST